MSEDDFKEVLPALGDRLIIRKALKRHRGLINRTIMRPQKKNVSIFATRKSIQKNDPSKKAFVDEMLKNVS